ncbi:alpha/beta fold hydrolase [Flavimaricola marinus]|uniref:Esterase YbfF n=1 Tax=Flavimaricola marinus TaxID=1819565 RepID=A0A238LG11_9RHOB|nr:alpha/beta fold hydrolase [Flavimaricola marinus]SMY08619.1 Esterase YbfF [Flavimaricola marinus]
MLNTIVTGAGSDRPPLLIAHGLFGSARNWGVIAKKLAAEGRQVTACDMRNHGSSPWHDSQSYEDMAADLAELLEATTGPADVLGHSMGGKASMMLALTRPDLVGRLIVADIAPVPYGHTQSHNIDAMRGVDLEAVTNRSEAAAQLALGDPGVEAFLLQSLDLKEKRWRLNLDVLEKDMAKILSFPAVSTQFDGPTLFLSGGASDYVSRDHRETIKALFPHARFAKIPGAGHWLHAEKPQEFIAAVSAFLNQ